MKTLFGQIMKKYKKFDLLILWLLADWTLKIYRKVILMGKSKTLFQAFCRI